jgi:hypothetical protein
MDQLAAQRNRFLQAASEREEKTPAAGSGSSFSMDTTEEEKEAAIAAAAAATAAASAESADPLDPDAEDNSVPVVETKEYTCCHCLMHGSATEERPIGLVTLIQVCTDAVIACFCMVEMPINIYFTKAP